MSLNGVGDLVHHGGVPRPGDQVRDPRLEDVGYGPKGVLAPGGGPLSPEISRRGGRGR